jgi:hypothetical protein
VTTRKASAFALAAWTLACAAPALAQTAGAASSSMAQSINNIIADLMTSGAALSLIYAIATLCGLLLIVIGIFNITEVRLGHKPASTAIAPILAGVALAGFQNTMGILNSSAFQSGAATSIMSSSVPTGADNLSATTTAFINLSIGIVQIVGLLAVFRGVQGLADVGMSGQHQPDQSRSAWVFIIAGVFCWNIVAMLKVIANTVGGQLLQTVSSILPS